MEMLQKKTSRKSFNESVIIEPDTLPDYELYHLFQSNMNISQSVEESAYTWHTNDQFSRSISNPVIDFFQML